MTGQLNKKYILVVGTVYCTSFKAAVDYLVIAKAIFLLLNNVINEESTKVRLPAVELF